VILEAYEPEVRLVESSTTNGHGTPEADHAIAAACALAESEKITLLVIEHNMRVMMALAHTVTVMQNGAVIAEGNPAEIQSNRRVIDAYLGDEAIDAVG